VDEDVTAGQYVVLHKSLEKEPWGMMAHIGDGTIVAGDPNLQQYGRRYYDSEGVVDAQDPRYRAWAAPVFNNTGEVHADPTAQVTLSRKHMDWFVDYFTDYATVEEANFDMIITTGRVRSKYTEIYTAEAQPLFSRPIPQPDLGYDAPTYTMPGTGRRIPIVTMRGCPEGAMFFCPLGDLMPAQVDRGWSTGTVHKYFVHMLPFTGDDIDRATYYHYWFLW